MNPIPDALFLRSFRQRPDFTSFFTKLVTGKEVGGLAIVLPQQRHVGSPGSIDLVVKCAKGSILLIENKIDAAYSVTREGFGQPHRYQKTVAAYRNEGTEAHSVLLAPDQYLKSSRLANMFDCCISYESVRDVIDATDRALLEAAIRQANTPYEPVPDEGAMEFFESFANFS